MGSCTNPIDSSHDSSHANSIGRSSNSPQGHSADSSSRPPQGHSAGPSSNSPQGHSAGRSSAYGYYGILEHLPEHYKEIGDVGKFMQDVSGFVTAFVQRKLTRDPDLAADYYLHFYERAEFCLMRFQGGSHLQFAAYLTAYLRHDFYNFVRGQRLRAINSQPEAHIPIVASPSQKKVNSTENRRNFLATVIEALPTETSLAVKLYHGFELNLTDLRLFVEKSANPAKAADFLASRRKRQKRAQERLHRLEERAARLNHTIHISTRQDYNSEWSRWKRRTNRLSERPVRFCSTGELAHLLGVSKSTVARRLRSALAAIHIVYQEEAWERS